LYSFYGFYRTSKLHFLRLDALLQARFEQACRLALLISTHFGIENMNRYRLTLAAAVCSALSLYFMDGETQHQLDNVAKANASAVSPTTTTLQAESSATENGEKETIDVEQSIDLEADNKELKLAFESPFPERTNLFQAPKRQGRGRSQAGGQSETSVELLGFVNVDGQRVALSIDGLVTTIAEGDEAFGIEVISIQPPSVFLRRGKQRWQASFEN